MVKTLMRSVREYKKSSILTPVFVTFEVILEVIIPLLIMILAATALILFFRSFSRALNLTAG